MLQCAAFKRYVSKLKVFAKRTIQDPSKLSKVLHDAYNVDFHRDELFTFYSNSDKGSSLKIAIHALASLLVDHQRNLIVSRNLYAALVLGVIFRKPLVFETHQIEFGFRGFFQKAIIQCDHIVTVVISQKLLELLSEHHEVNLRQPLVLHDAAIAEENPTSPSLRRRDLHELLGSDVNEWSHVCGYFGHLYYGRGIEIIEAMAKKRPEFLFLVYGGNDSEVLRRKNLNKQKNLRFMGFVPHPLAKKVMKAVDSLLMPYQEKVSIGAPGHDTGEWMSPMKMFEYMSTGVPIISSNLPVLREVLVNRKNAILVKPSDVDDWLAGLDSLHADPALSSRIGEQSFKDLQERYTWKARAKAILEAGKRLF